MGFFDEKIEILTEKDKNLENLRKESSLSKESIEGLLNSLSQLHEKAREFSQPKKDPISMDVNRSFKTWKDNYEASRKEMLNEDYFEFANFSGTINSIYLGLANQPKLTIESFRPKQLAQSGFTKKEYTRIVELGKINRSFQQLDQVKQFKDKLFNALLETDLSGIYRVDEINIIRDGKRFKEYPLDKDDLNYKAMLLDESLISKFKEQFVNSMKTSVSRLDDLSVQLDSLDAARAKFAVSYKPELDKLALNIYTSKNNKRDISKDINPSVPKAYFDANQRFVFRNQPAEKFFLPVEHKKFFADKTDASGFKKALELVESNGILNDIEDFYSKNPTLLSKTPHLVETALRSYLLSVSFPEELKVIDSFIQVEDKSKDLQVQMAFLTNAGYTAYHAIIYPETGASVCLDELFEELKLPHDPEKPLSSSMIYREGNISDNAKILTSYINKKLLSGEFKVGSVKSLIPHSALSRINLLIKAQREVQAYERAVEPTLVPLTESFYSQRLHQKLTWAESLSAFINERHDSKENNDLTSLRSFLAAREELNLTGPEAFYFLFSSFINISVIQNTLERMREAGTCAEFVSHIRKINPIVDTSYQYFEAQVAQRIADIDYDLKNYIGIFEENSAKLALENYKKAATDPNLKAYLILKFALSNSL